jgi:cell division protein FtsW (lipid II flippase)
MKRLVLIAMLLATTPALALTVSNDRGGVVVVYALKVAKLRQSGEPVRITGPCLSACTLYLSLGKQVCITPRALFKFHAPYGASSIGNRNAKNYLMQRYPAWVRGWIYGHGGLSAQIITINYDYANKHIKECV